MYLSLDTAAGEVWLGRVDGDSESTGNSTPLSDSNTALFIVRQHNKVCPCARQCVDGDLRVDVRIEITVLLDRELARRVNV